MKTTLAMTALSLRPEPLRLRLLRSGALGLLVVALTAVWPTPILAGDCPGDIGCTTCVARFGTPNRPPIIFCSIEDHNGGCACFTWESGGEIYCDNYGTCIYEGWQGGDPPRV